MVGFEAAFLMLTGNTIKGAVERGMYPNQKCSVNEIIEKTNVTEEDILRLLKMNVIKGKVIFGVPYIMRLSAYGVVNKLREYKQRPMLEKYQKEVVNESKRNTKTDAREISTGN